ncbi:MAG: IMP cyclohydrolase [Myxococcota bacterium]
MEIREQAHANLERHLKRNPYPGRGLVIGRAEGADAWQLVYWIMGRSESSRSRRFVAEAGTLRTEPTDPERLENPSLTLYEAMLELPGLQLVSNGDQTRTVQEFLSRQGRFEDALATREREPDAPHYTPRIAGLLDLRGSPELALAILKASPADPARTDRFIYRPAAPPAGLGLGLTTYAGDGDPLPSYRGEPLWLPLGGSPEQTLERFWDALDPGNRVALAVKSVPAAGGPSRLLVRNRHP